MTSTCPANSSALFSCGEASCSKPGDIINLDTLCTNDLTGSKLSYTVNGAPAAGNYTCPANGAALTIVPAVLDFGGNAACDYFGSPITVTCEPA